MTDHLLRAHTRAVAALTRGADERGDVPGWVLITLMTAALVTAIWAVAGDQLTGIFQDALDGVVSDVGN